MLHIILCCWGVGGCLGGATVSQGKFVLDEGPDKARLSRPL